MATQNKNGNLPVVAMTECPVCHIPQPTTAEFFPLKKDGTAGKMCMNCVRSAGLRHAEKEKREAIQRATRELIKAAKGNQIHSPHVAQICAEMFTQGGGVKEVCRLWWQQIKKACDKRPGSKTALDQFYALFKMSAAVGEHVREDVRLLSDEELDNELFSLIETYCHRVHNLDELNGDSPGNCV